MTAGRAVAHSPQQEGRLHLHLLSGWFLGAPMQRIISPDQSTIEKRSKNNEQPFEGEPNRRKREKLTKGNKS